MFPNVITTLFVKSHRQVTSLYAGQPEQSGFGDGLPEEAKFNQPECVTVYPDNSVYVADRDNHVIRRVTVE